MLARSFPVAQPALPREDRPGCTYLVGYPGPAQDLNAWLSHYISGHPGLMARLPGIRAIEIFTRLDCCSGLPWPQEQLMLRNTVTFDSPAALDAALKHPARELLREDFHRFPPYAGGSQHFPMRTRALLPGH
jgi:hypothetical protein